MKPAEDGSGDLILRLYESKKAATDARVQLSPEILAGGHVYACDMLENVEEELPVSDGALTLPSIRLKSGPSGFPGRSEERIRDKRKGGCEK